MASAEPDRVLHAGVARVVITPPVGIRTCGYTVQEGASRGIERDLTATALVLSGGPTKVALLAVDILFIQAPHAERIRERIGVIRIDDLAGGPIATVMTAGCHTVVLGPLSRE